METQDEDIIDNQDDKKPYKNPKLYVALTVCLGAISIAGWSTYKSIKEVMAPSHKIKNNINTASKNTNKNTNKTQNNTKNHILDDNQNSNTQKSIVPYENTEKNTKNNNKNIKIPEINTPDNQETQAVMSLNVQNPQIVYPVENNTIIKEFSDEKPVYSKTFGDWRSHQGTDFKAEPGSDVKSITSGTVTDIYDDQLYGTTVVISHDPNFTAYYSGLDQNTCVTKGQKVNPEEKIGFTNKIPCESLDEPHLHLMINQDNKFIDPVLILENNKNN